VFPTETVWGIGCKFDDEKAVERIYEIKGRNSSNPLQIQLSSISDIDKYSSEPMSDGLKSVCSSFLPGPLSIVLKKKNVPDFTTSNLDTVSIRVSSCPEVLDLVAYLGYPLASTSCNKSGEPVLTNYEDIRGFAESYCDIFISKKYKTYDIGSTVIGYSNSEVQLFREGVIKFDEILKSMGK
jgi:L-threonylcarbamoyladenylate synthase